MRKRSSESPNNLLQGKDHDLSASLTLGDGLSSSFDQLDPHEHEEPRLRLKLQPVQSPDESEGKEAGKPKATQKPSARKLQRRVTWQAQEGDTATGIKAHQHCEADAAGCRKIVEEDFEDFEDVSPMHAKFRICKQKSKQKCMEHDGRTPVLTRVVKR